MYSKSKNGALKLLANQNTSMEYLANIKETLAIFSMSTRSWRKVFIFRKTEGLLELQSWKSLGKKTVSCVTMVVLSSLLGERKSMFNPSWYRCGWCSCYSCTASFYFSQVFVVMTQRRHFSLFASKGGKHVDCEDSPCCSITEPGIGMHLCNKQQHREMTTIYWSPW